MKASPYAWLALLLVICFTLATRMEIDTLRSSPRKKSDNFISKALGDGRRMFANQFFTMADVYLHSGFYPSIFDRQAKPKASALHGEHDEHDDHDHNHDGKPDHDAKDHHEDHDHDRDGKPDHDAKDHHGDHDHDHDGKPDHDAKDHPPADTHATHEEEFSFMGEPRNWIERFGRHFKVSAHTHLENGQQREVLPWLELAAEMDPQMIQTYTAAAFMLRKELKRPKAAEEFLREGLRNNPLHYELLFELGVIYKDDYNDPDRARNLWLGSLSRWRDQDVKARVASADLYGKLTASLGRLEESAGNWKLAIHYLEMAKEVSPQPGALQKQIDEIRVKHGEAPEGFPLLQPL